MRKDRLDGVGLAAMLAVTLLLAVNQIMVKEVNTGLQPVFFAGLRSALAVVFVGGWLWYRGLLGRLRWSDLGPGVLMGVVFAAEFLCLFMALDLTAVGRASVIFYSMAVVDGGSGAFLVAGGNASRRFAPPGLCWPLRAPLGRSCRAAPRGHANIWGDLFALGGALGWTGTAFIARATRMREAGPEAQLFWMVVVSAPILLLAAPFFGPLIRDVVPLHCGWRWCFRPLLWSRAASFLGCGCCRSIPRQRWRRFRS